MITIFLETKQRHGTMLKQLKNAYELYGPKNRALAFILFLGTVSLFTDMTYESARSIAGPYLALLGATGTIVGIVAGLGELVGYGLRIVSGILIDRAKAYWLMTFVGYSCTLITIPLLALAGNWPLAATLLVLERMGKAIRNPARDAMLSYSAHEMGSGLGFGIHQALDQTGAFLGPLLVTVMLYFQKSYQECFAILFIPALIALSVLWIARKLYPQPQALEKSTPSLEIQNSPQAFWIYLIACAFIALGYADFPLIAYHFGKALILKPIWIPIFYSISMGTSAISALLLGRMYDRRGMLVVILATLISSPFALLVFLGKFYVALVGMILWGIGMGAQRSLIKAVIGNMVPKSKRASAFGIFNAGFGIAWFLGSAAMGLLYDYSMTGLITVSIVTQLASLPFFLVVQQKIKAKR